MKRDGRGMCGLMRAALRKAGFCNARDLIVLESLAIDDREVWEKKNNRERRPRDGELVVWSRVVVVPRQSADINRADLDRDTPRQVRRPIVNMTILLKTS